MPTKQDRLQFFAERALRNCLLGAGANHSTPIRGYLGVGSPTSLHTNELVGVLDKVAPACSISWQGARHGRSAFFEALHEAHCAIQAGEVRFALVGAVDSLCDDDSLLQLSREGRLLSDRNFDGIIPGEAAGFVLLARNAARESTLATVAATAVAQDTVPFGSRSPHHALGLSAVFRELSRQGGAAPRPAHLHSGQPSETFWGRELNRAYLRNAALMPEPFTVSFVHECLGDVGAAAGAVTLAHSMSTAGQLTRKRARTLHYAASDGGSVAGCVVDHPY